MERTNSAVLVQIVRMEAITNLYAVLFDDGLGGPEVGDAWNAATDALDALCRERDAAVRSAHPSSYVPRETLRLVEENRD